jgi:formate dehydrogenase major subunit
MHVERFVRGKGQFMLTDYVATDERTGPRFPLLLTTGRILSQYNVGAQTRRTENSRWHEEDVLEIHPFDAESRGVRDGDLVSLQSRVGEVSLHAKVSERMQPGVVYTTFHHPNSGANVVTTENSDWATNCPEYKVTAVQIRRTNHYSEWQERDREEGVARRRIAGAEVHAAECGSRRGFRAGARLRLRSRRLRARPAPRDRRRDADPARVRRRAFRRDDGDAARPQGFRRRLRPDRGNRRANR